MDTTKNTGIDRRVIRIFIELAVLLAVLILLISMIGKLWQGQPEDTHSGETTQQTTQQTTASTTETTVPPDTSPEGIKQAFFQEHGLTEADYLEGMFEVYEYFPEVRDFILNYPLKKDTVNPVDISGYDRSQGVPLFYQWDEMWGYLPYGKGICGLSGCGPTSLAMVAYYLTGNTEYTPVYMMEFAQSNGHTGSKGGTNWSLFNEGAVELGLKVEELPLYEGAIKKRLEAGIPIVVNVGPGDFTRNGHYMVLVGYENGMIRINDCFSKINSEKLWSYDQIEGQIKNLWAISLPE